MVEFCVNDLRFVAPALMTLSAEMKGVYFGTCVKMPLINRFWPTGTANALFYH